VTPGASIAHYRITAKLGQGGMGEVWRATDTRLNRDVAIKVLPAALSGDTQYMARFEREAQTLAALNHPNIAAIYGIEQGAIVMELVEGETLPCPVPLETALDYARQIAVGLEAAHEKGIVHRDLKPANVKITPAGVVKLLDFGLAKSAGEAVSAASATISPTLSLAMTQAGMILGTAAYMAPEQARGKPVDKRADIWAFGVVLYEMLTGKTLYGGGETLTDTIAAVVTREPDWTALPSGTPPRVRRLLERCLRKDPKQRLRDIGEARVILDEDEPGPAASPAIAPRASKLPWIAAVVTLIAGAAAGAWWTASRTPTALPMRLNVTLAPEAIIGTRATLLFSPSGERLLFPGAPAPGRSILYSRLLDEVAAKPIPGTEGLTNVDAAFSPDGRSIAFFRQRQLWKLGLNGGSPEALCESPNNNRGISWGENGVIVFTNVVSGKLMRVSESGGNPVELTDPRKAGEAAHAWPQILPGGSDVLFTAAKRTYLVWITRMPRSKPFRCARARSGRCRPAATTAVMCRAATWSSSAMEPCMPSASTPAPRRPADSRSRSSRASAGA
jgi:serine/threonine-protein kinase